MQKCLNGSHRLGLLFLRRNRCGQVPLLWAIVTELSVVSAFNLHNVLRVVDVVLHAFYVGGVEAAQLRRQIKEQLPYFMVPSTLTAVEKFPLTKNGKIDRKELLKGGGKRG